MLCYRSCTDFNRLLYVSLPFLHCLISFKLYVNRINNTAHSSTADKNIQSAWTNLTVCLPMCVCVYRHVIDGHKMILLREDDKEQKVRHFPLHSSLVLLLLLQLLLLLSIYLFFIISLSFLSRLASPSLLFLCSFPCFKTYFSIFLTYLKGRSMYIRTVWSVRHWCCDDLRGW